jgi:hypothetical protein
MFNYYTKGIIKERKAFMHFIILTNIINDLKLNMLIRIKFMLKHSVKINFVRKTCVFRLALELKVQREAETCLRFYNITHKVIVAYTTVILAIATTFVNANFVIFFTLNSKTNKLAVLYYFYATY